MPASFIVSHLRIYRKSQKEIPASLKAAGVRCYSWLTPKG